MICWCFLAGRRVIWPIAWLTREKCPITNRSLLSYEIARRLIQADTYCNATCIASLWYIEVKKKGHENLRDNFVNQPRHSEGANHPQITKLS